MYRNYSLSTHTKSNRFFGKINLWISQKKKKVKLFRHNWRRPRFLNSDFVFRIRPFFCSSILLFVFCKMCSSLGETFRWSSIPYPYPRQAWHGMACGTVHTYQLDFLHFNTHTRRRLIQKTFFSLFVLETPFPSFWGMVEIFPLPEMTQLDASWQSIKFVKIFICHINRGPFTSNIWMSSHGHAAKFLTTWNEEKFRAIKKIETFLSTTRASSISPVVLTHFLTVNLWLVAAKSCRYNACLCLWPYERGQ